MAAAGNPSSAAACWWITRKAQPGPGGMERLSSELVTRVGERRPLTLVAHRGGRLGLPAFLAHAAIRLSSACRRGEVALVHLGDPVLAPLAGLAHRAGVPVSLTVHGLDVTWSHPAYRAMLRRFLPAVDACVCISAATAEAAIRAGAPASRIEVIGIGIDLPPLAGEPRMEDRLLFVGRLVRRKGVEWFVREVLPVLAATRPALVLTIIGGGPERHRIEDAARAVGVVDRVRFEGAVDDAAKSRWFARATMCVMPNIAVANDLEGYGIVALEAAAVGCPLVAADLEGLRDAVVDGRSGLLVASGDAQAWQRAVGDMLDDPAGRAALGERARATVSAERRWDDVVDRYVTLFERLAPSASTNRTG